MLTPEDFTPEKLRIHWSAIFLIFAIQLTAAIVLSMVVANHSISTSSTATEVVRVEPR